MKRWAALALALCALGAPASAASIFDYTKMTFDAKISVDGRAFTVMLHNKRDTFLLQPSMTEALTEGGAPTRWPLPIWRKAAETFVEPVGCGISDVSTIMRSGASWEAAYVCPPGVDLRALVRDQRDDLRHGVPLHP